MEPFIKIILLHLTIKGPIFQKCTCMFYHFNISTNKQTKIHFQRGKTWEIDASLNEKNSTLAFPLKCSLSNSSSSLMENAGFLGLIMAAASFLSIKETANMEGLSTGFSCTQRRATCMHLRILQLEDESSSVDSTKDMP